MSLRGVQINEGAIGANVAGDGREFGLIGNGVAVANKLALETHYQLRRLSDAVALGIDAAYDADNSVNLYRHIAEFYRMAGEGKKLHLMVVAQTVPVDEMDTPAKNLLVAADGTISDLAFAFNPAAGYTETLLDGINADVAAAIPLLQALAEWADGQDMPLHCIVECRGITDTLNVLDDLRGMADSNTKVTLVAGQDWNYADGLWTLGKKFADVGTFLGVVASQAWNRNPGEVATQNLTNASLGAFVVAGLSNHKKYSEVYADLETMNDKGYVFPIKYQGIVGYWWNDGHTCAPIVNDTAGNINQHTIYYSHTIDECKRALRIAFLPEVKKVVELDEEGKLPASMVDYYNAIGDTVFERMYNKGLISSGRTFTDPESDLLIEKVLMIQFAVVPTGCVNEIVGTINLKNQ